MKRSDGKAAITHLTTRGTKKCGQFKEEIRRTYPNFYPPRNLNKEMRLRDPSNPSKADGANIYVTTLLGDRKIATCELKGTQLDVPTGPPDDTTAGGKVCFFNYTYTSQSNNK